MRRHLDVAAKGLLAGYIEAHGWRLTAAIQAASAWPQVQSAEHRSGRLRSRYTRILGPNVSMTTCSLP